MSGRPFKEVHVKVPIMCPSTFLQACAAQTAPAGRRAGVARHRRARPAVPSGQNSVPPVQGRREGGRGEAARQGGRDGGRK